MTIEQTAGKYPAKITLSEQAETYIERLAKDLVAGTVELHQLPSSLLALWTFAFENGHEAAAATYSARLKQAENDAQRYYEAWTNPGKKLTPAHERWVHSAGEIVDDLLDQLAAGTKKQNMGEAA